MRITNLLSFNRFQDNLQSNMKKLAKFQHQLSTGKRVAKPSDDNVAFGTSRLIQETTRNNEQYQSNIKTGLSQARVVQGGLENMVDVLIDLKTTVINASTDSLDEIDRESLADKVASYKERIMDLANSKYGSMFVFGGTNTDTEPFSENATAPGEVADTSTNSALKIQASEISKIETTVTGKELRNTDAGDLFEIMQTVEAALRADDRQAVSDAQKDIETAISHVTGLAAGIGNNINRMEFLNDQFESSGIDLKADVSRLTDADFAEAITNFNKYETTYQAALSTHSRISQLSLLNYL